MQKNILNKDNTKILICCHKESELPNNKDGLFLPIHVGAKISDKDLGFCRDDKINNIECDNISDKNKSFCEITALYWAWKNLKKLYPNIEYIGLNHYRRYFSFDKKDIVSTLIEKEASCIKDYNINLGKLNKILNKYDCIAAKKAIFPYSLEVQYCLSHNSSDLRHIKNIIQEKYPEYLEAMNEVIFKGNKCSFFNMFILKWQDFDNYCKWLFDILFESEKRIDTTGYDSMQLRVFGFIAERLFTVWIIKNIKKIKYLNVIKYDENISPQPKMTALKERIKNSLAFTIYSKPLGLSGLFKFLVKKIKK